MMHARFAFVDSKMIDDVVTLCPFEALRAAERRYGLRVPAKRAVTSLWEAAGAWKKCRRLKLTGRQLHKVLASAVLSSYSSR